MKKIYLFFAALAAMFTAGACDQVLEFRPPAEYNTSGLSEEDIEQIRNPADTSGGAYVEAQGSGKLLSKGPASAKGAKTYYLDAQNGDDANSGTHPLKPWKSFRNVNLRTFKPGDHILLEANSVWNGEKVTLQNYTTLAVSDKVGMLWLKGSGVQTAPIVIDLYRMVFAAAGDPDQRPKVYWSADKRPLINGNGTPSINASQPYAASAPITLDQTDWVEVRNIELTNTFDNPLTNPNHWSERYVPKGLLGLNGIPPVNGYQTGIRIEQCYIHDVQSEHDNNNSGNPTAWAGSTYFGGTHTPVKGVGGLLIDRGYDLEITGNIIKKVGLEGLRAHGRSDRGGGVDKMLVRGNYVETVSGDGIVVARTGTQGTSELGGYGCLVESNVIKDACAAVLASANYAGCWVYYGNNTLFQYNECYGIIYGFNDGEAWDIDSQSNNVVYQYNYSHHNAGGCILFMSGIAGGIFRFNISANDGGGTKYMATVPDPASGFTIDTSASSYTTWNNGQCLFHYTSEVTSANANIPLIYNNTFYVGDGITCGLFGHHTTSAVNKYVRFANNILIKAGSGKLYLSYGQSGNGNAGKISNESGFKYNLVWGYDMADPAVGLYDKFDNGSGSSPQTLFAANGNTWSNPKLKIQTDAAGVQALRDQRNDVFSPLDYVNPEALKEFTGKTKLRDRAKWFVPTAPLPKSGTSVVGFDNAWNTAVEPNEDFFGKKFTTTPIGAAIP